MRSIITYTYLNIHEIFYNVHLLKHMRSFITYTYLNIYEIYYNVHLLKHT